MNNRHAAFAAAAIWVALVVVVGYYRPLASPARAGFLAQPITATLTITATLGVSPTLTATLTPEPTQPVSCAVLSYWSVPPGGLAYIEARLMGSGGRWMPYATVDTPWPLPAIVLYGEYEYLVGIPGPTTAPEPPPTEVGPTPPPVPTQTPWVVTATPLPTVPATATPTSHPSRIYLALLLRKWGRWQWDPPIPTRP